MNRVKRIVHARKVYERGYSGRGIRIAVVDSGCSLTPRLGNNPVFFKDFVHGRDIPYDDYGHGTHIAGIICGRSPEGDWSGMAPGAELVVLKVLDERGNGSTKAAVSALRWILKMRRRFGIRLLNFSMGYLPGGKLREQELLLDVVDELWDSGVCVVTAAGNNGPVGGSVTIPGISRKVITVGAGDDHEGNGSGLYRGYSGRGPTGCCIVKPEILAPGTGIRSLSPSGFAVKSGTSMAVPVVCGALALALEQDPSLTPAELKLKLYRSVDPLPGTAGRRCWGMLNVDQLLEL